MGTFKITIPGVGDLLARNSLEPDENINFSKKVFSPSEDLTADSFFSLLVKTLILEPSFSKEEINNFSELEIRSFANFFGGVLNISSEFSLFDQALPAKVILFESFKSANSLYLWASKNERKDLDLSEWFRYLATAAKSIDLELYEHLLKAGFWISPNMRLDFHGYIHGKIIAGEVGDENIRKSVCNYFKSNNYSNLFQLIHIWLNDPSFKNRQELIFDALEAHMNQKYSLSIPPLLLQFEGITLEKFGYKKRNENNPVNKFLDYFTKNKSFEYFQKSTIDNFLQLLDPIYSYIEFKKISYQKWLENNNLTENQTLQRHAIAHGLSWNYASEENSIRAFLLLDMVACYPM